MKKATGKRGRPSEGKSERFQIKFTEAERQQLDTYSAKLKQDKSEIIRNAIAEYIGKHSQNAFTLPMFK